MLVVHFIKGANSRLKNEKQGKYFDSFLKVSGEIHGKEFNSRLDSNFTGRMVTLLLFKVLILRH